MKSENCYLCGGPADTKDHVPPRGCFPPTFQGNLVTVPSCGSCNNGSSMDDRYFQFCVAASCADDERAMRIVDDGVLPGLRRCPGLTRQIIRSAVPRVGVTSDEGIILEERPGIYLDRPAVHRVVNRIVRGLSWKHNGQPPDGFAVGTFYWNPPFSKWKDIFTGLSYHEPVKDVFSYRFGVAVDDPSASLWGFVFYRKLFIVSVTGMQRESPLKSATAG